MLDPYHIEMLKDLYIGEAIIVNIWLSIYVLSKHDINGMALMILLNAGILILIGLIWAIAHFSKKEVKL